MRLRDKSRPEQAGSRRSSWVNQTEPVVSTLGIDVGADLVRSWASWLAPEVQPFFVESLGQWPAGVDGPSVLSAEQRDTYEVWNLDRTLKVLWLDESTFAAMPRADRAALVRLQARSHRGAVPMVRRWSDLFDAAALRSQADGHRFVWWPSHLDSRAVEVLMRAVSNEALPSRHKEVSESTWKASAAVLPCARALAGSFAPGSGANCFGTVMAAAGVASAAERWMLQKPFSDWLGAECRPGGHDDEPGTVLVWRDDAGQPVHAAVTVGGGWALEKPSQTWSTPRVILPVRDVIRSTRSPGKRLERRHLRRSQVVG